MYFIFNVCYIPFIPLSSKSSAEEMSFFHFLPPVRKKVNPGNNGWRIDWLILLVYARLAPTWQYVVNFCGIMTLFIDKLLNLTLVEPSKTISPGSTKKKESSSFL